jgi:hypothetical protein
MTATAPPRDSDQESTARNPRRGGGMGNVPSRQHRRDGTLWDIWGIAGPRTYQRLAC